MHTIDNQLVLCEALDVTHLTAEQVADAVDEQNCGTVDDSDGDVMNTYVDQKITISIGLCILHEIFAALQALDGGFTGCFNTVVNIYFLKVCRLTAACMCKQGTLIPSIPTAIYCQYSSTHSLCFHAQ